MTAIEDADRLNYTRGSGTNRYGWQADQSVNRTVDLPWDAEDPKNRKFRVQKEENGRGIAHVNRKEEVPSAEEEIDV